MTHSKTFAGSLWIFLLPVLLTMMTGCGATDSRASKDSEPVDSADVATVQTKKKIPKLDVKQLLGELPPSFPEDAYVDFPEVGVRVVPPAGFVRAKRFHGFIDAFSNSTVMITTAPVSFPEIAKNYILNVGMVPQLEAQSSYTSTIEIGGQEAAFAYLVQETTTGPRAKHFIAFGDEKTSTFVTGDYPQELQDEFAKEVLRSIMSARLIPGSVAAEPGSDVDFTLSAPTLKVTPGWSKAIVYTKDGVYPLADPTDPCFKAAPAMEEYQVDAAERADFARQHLIPSPGIRIENIFIDRDITVDGLPGRELMALADDLSTNTPILLYAAVLFEDDSFITLHGWAGQFVEEDWGAEFKAITASFKRK